MRTRFTLLMLLMILVNISSLSLISITMGSSSDLWVIVSYSFRSSVGGDVYPGSRDAKLVITARYSGSDEAFNSLACLEAPQWFKPSISSCTIAKDQDGNNIYTVRPGDVVFFIFTISVDANTPPGYYSAKVNISFYDPRLGAYLWEVDEIELYVSDYPEMEIAIHDAYFSPYAYPGACPVDVIIGLSNIGKSSILYMRMTLELPSDLANPAILNSTYPYMIETGEMIYLTIGETCINPSATPNETYKALLKIKGTLQTSDGVVYGKEGVYEIELSVSDRPPVDVRLITYGLTSDLSIPGLRNTGLRIMVESRESSPVLITYSVLRLENALTLNNTSIGVYVHNIQLSYMDTAWITYSGLNILENVSYLYASITIHGLTVKEGAQIPFSIEFHVTIPLVRRELDIRIVKAGWIREIAYPGSTNNVFVLSIFNNEPALYISDGIVEIYSPDGIIYPDRNTAYNVIINPGGISEVEFPGLIIPGSVKPGLYRIIVKIKASARCIDNSFIQLYLEREVYVPIAELEDIDRILPVFNIINAFWGEMTPQFVYPGNPRAPLTITIQNTALTSASFVLLTIEKVEPGNIGVLSNSSICSQYLSPGSSCSAVFYLDLSNSTSGMVAIHIIAKYTLPDLGINTILIQRLKASVFLPSYTPGGYVDLVDYGWLNNYPVFPRSKGAVLTLTFANLEPYPVSALRISLDLPECMHMHRQQANTVYYPGPVASLQTFTVSFMIDISCNPGRHLARVEIDYYLQAYGGGIRKRIVHPITLIVENDENSIEYITSGWLNTPLTPPVQGAQLYVIFRNNRFPSITSPLLKLKLPDGLVESRTNSREPVLLPSMVINPQQLIQARVQDLGELASRLITASQQIVSNPTTYRPGDIIVYIVSLNIDKLENSSIPFELRFIDHWNEEYTISSSFLPPLITTPPLLRIKPDSPLIVFNNGTAILDLIVMNEYNSSIGNLYVALIPVSGNAIPQGSLAYIERLGGRSNVTVRFNLVYNPVQSMIGSVPISMSSAVFTVAMLYTDNAGILHNINTSLAVMIKPFIDVKLLPGVTARYSSNTLVVSGVLANTGISTARSVAVYVNYGDKTSLTIIGDLDPSTQIPFIVELQAPYHGDQCNIVIKYLDQYGVEYAQSELLNITFVTEEATTVQHVGQQADTTMRIIVVVIIALFLGLLFLGLYRHSRQVMKRVTHAST